MKPSSILIPLAVLALAAGAQAQTRIWRCGNSYTNDEVQAKAQNCKLMEGGNVTVVQGNRPIASAASSSAVRAPASATSPAGSPRVDGADQRARDGEARSVLESEIRKAQDRQAQLLKEYNNGEPEKQGSEGRNYQKYLDRVAEMKAELARNESDIAGIQREIGRLK